MKLHLSKCLNQVPIIKSKFKLSKTKWDDAQVPTINIVDEIDN